MASKRTTRRKTPRKGRKLTKPELKKLLDDALTEVANLLKGHRRGTLESVDLEAGLVEIKNCLHEMEPFDEGFPPVK